MADKEVKKIDTEKLTVKTVPVAGSVTSDDLSLSKDKVVNTVIDENKAELSIKKLSEQMGSVSVKLKSIPEGKKDQCFMSTGGNYNLSRETLDFFQEHGFEFELNN
ncbi:hypothetical protein ABE425_14635 [Chryseobacterium cucumeris]|uniref:hypothetical protein n=1 Tax=Chryseobacterium cucumeris TaxID=1813611 RepID=UPI00320ABBAC